MNDIDQSLREIQPCSEHLREEMVRLSTYGYRRSRTQGWVDRMPVLVINQLSDVTPISSQLESGLPKVEPGASSSAPHCLTSDETILQLTPRSTLKDASAYVAVSYCWERDNPAWSSNESDKPLQVIGDTLSRRPINAPPDVLYRSIAYAKAQNINAIWIDQECIDQNDPVDKENAIQEMDMVYQESKYAIAVLEFSFETQTELDLFASFCDKGPDTFEPNQIVVLESVLEALTEDSWFERAWTLQESVSAGARMTLLLGCPGLQKSPNFGHTPEEFEISIFDFQHAMVNVRLSIEEGLAASVWSDPSSANNASNCADILWNYIPTFIPDFTNLTWKEDAPKDRIRTAAQALTFLDSRLNSNFPDRLAILANLCDYEYRIKTEVLELPSISFSICCLTLAILNGDMSLLGGYREGMKMLRDKYGWIAWSIGLNENRRSLGLVYENDDYDLQSNTYGFSWGPKPVACLDNITYLDEQYGAVFRLRPATLSMHGLRVCGVLWDVKCTASVPNTQKRFASRWQEEITFQKGERAIDGLERQTPLVQDFFWLLLHELIESGFHELSRTLWNYVQPLGSGDFIGKEEYDSLAAPLPYSYEMIFGHLAQNSAANQHIMYDEREVRSRISAPHLNFDPENEASDRPNITRLLIEQVCKDGNLVCGAPLHAPLTKQPYVWFEACKVGDQIFTPVTDVGNGTAQSGYRNQAMSWRVVATGQSADDCDVLHCLGRRRGVWRLEGLDHQDYVLD